MGSFYVLAALAVFVVLVVLARRSSESASASFVDLKNASVEELIAAGRKIEAIKLHRAQTGVGLKEAKHAVEEMALGLPKA